MYHFFRHAVDSKLTASPAYFELLLQQFQADKTSGFLSAQVLPDRQLVVLFANGVCIGSFRIDVSGSHPLDVIEKTWPTSEAPVRILVAPSSIARAIWQVFLWGVPDHQVLEAFCFEDYLGECRRQKCCGLLYVCTPSADGFLTLWEGEISNAETLFDGPRGFVETSPLSRRAMESPFEEWEVDYYPCQMESISGQLFVLRLALVSWMNRALTHYQDLVGQNLVINANHQFNALARRHFLDIRTVGATMIDRQYFPNLTQMVAAYWLLLPSLLNHMSQVIGTGLVHRIIYGALNELSPQQARAMDEAGFGQHSDLWKQ